MIASLMPRDFTLPFNVIKKYVEQQVPGLTFEMMGNALTARVRLGAQQGIVSCSQEDLSDLEEALTNSTQPAKYKNRLIRDVTLRALVAVGKQGMAPEVDVSKLIVNEELDSAQVPPMTTSFDQETAKRLYDGLKLLDALAVQLTTSDARVPEIENEHKVMAPIIAFYEAKGHLDSSGVSKESLAYLKAAAFCWILELEEKRNAITSRRVKGAQSVRLFELLEKFWLVHPFDRLALPPIIRDYISQRPAMTKIGPGVSGPSLEIGPQLKKLDPRLEERWRGAWQALLSENPDKVSQAANSMVEVLDKVIGHVCGGRPFKDVLAERYPKQVTVIVAQRATVAALKESLHSVKHETHAQSVHTAEDLMHAAEGIIRTLLRTRS